MMKRHNLVAALSLVAALGFANSESFAQSRGIPADKKTEIFEALNRGVPHVTNEMLVQFSATATQADKARALRLIVGQRKEVVVPKAKQSLTNEAPSVLGDLELVTLPKGLAVSSAMRSIERDSAVVFAEPNWIYKHQAADTRVTSGSLWGMYGDADGQNLYGSSFTQKNEYGSHATEIWSKGKTDCSSVYIGIIDEGYFFNHEDLKANAGTNPGEIAGNGKDDDGNLLIDDVYGWDFDGNNSTVFDGVGDDHGTHVAGTIGAVGDNGRGVAGVCWKINLLNAKFLGSRGGTTANAVKSVNYFTDLKIRHSEKLKDLIATSNSWGGGGFSQSLKNAIGAASKQDILFIAAAGNNGANCEASDCYPAEYTFSGSDFTSSPSVAAFDNVIAVASLKSDGTRSTFSNFGKTTVDLGAPGEGILSTIPVRCSGNICSAYATYSGTSMATPHVTGAAALYKAINPNATAAQVKNALLSAAAATSTISMNELTVTNGRLNVGGFVTPAP